jgi:beta-fructofuranosidase
MLRLPDDWLWDFWFAEDGSERHLFFLTAPRSLPDPDDRHLNARIGHAASSDLRSWARRPDALVPGEPGAFDHTATWTGSVVRADDGTWFLFYTGADVRGSAPGPIPLNRQTVGVATSPDLMTWTKHPGNPVAVADGRWYEVLGAAEWQDEPFRDPWVLRDPAGDGWHMLITARGNSGAADDRGVIGHARSTDLLTWETLPPLSAPGAGFGHLEVPQVERVDGRWVLIFSCLTKDAALHRQDGAPAGVWVAAADGPLGPFHLADAWPLTDDTLYSGRLARDPAGGGWVLLAFRNVDPASGGFVGELSDPMPVGWRDGRLAILGQDGVAGPGHVDPAAVAQAAQAGRVDSSAGLPR